MIKKFSELSKVELLGMITEATHEMLQRESKVEKFVKREVASTVEEKTNEVVGGVVGPNSQSIVGRVGVTMKQPTIMYDGVECKVHGINWDSKGKISGVTFYDLSDKFHVAHEKMEWNVEGYDEYDSLYMDFEKALAHNGEG